MLNLFGQSLKKRREQLGLTIEQIFYKTKIDKKFLEMMEQGNFSFLPELYIKAFIREYAVAVELNPDETISQYLLAKESKLPQDRQSSTEDSVENIQNPENTISSINQIKNKSNIDDNLSNQSDGNSFNKIPNTKILIFSFFFLILGSFVYFLILSDNEIVIEEIPFEQTITERQRFEEFENNTLNDTSLTKDSLSLEIFSNDTSWIYLIVDNLNVTDRLLYPNRKTVFKAKSKFEGTIGNSKSVVLYLNGKNLGFVGREKFPRHFRIEKSTGLEYLTSRPILNKTDAR